MAALLMLFVTHPMPAQGTSNARQPGLPLLSYDWKGPHSLADAEHPFAPGQPGFAVEMPSWQADTPASCTSVTGTPSRGCWGQVVGFVTMLGWIGVPVPSIIDEGTC